MKERLIEFLQKEGLSSAVFAQEIGIQPSSVSHVLSGRNKPSLDFVIKLLTRYKDLRSDWFLFGSGPMYNKNLEPSLFEQEEESRRHKPMDETWSGDPPVKEFTNVNKKDTDASGEGTTVSRKEKPLVHDEQPVPYGRKQEEPERVILVYSDESFRILRNRK